MKEKNVFSNIKIKTIKEEEKELFRTHGRRIDCEGFTLYQIPLTGDVYIDSYEEPTKDEEQEIIDMITSPRFFGFNE